jgi:glycerol-3-phosphate acyltransferase PlsY
MGGLFSSYASLALIVGYLIGSIPFGLVLTYTAGLGDVRKIGSGNIGATNVLRTGHKGLAAATLLLDLLKGTMAVLIVDRVARAYGASEAFQFAYLAGLGAFLGHLFPVWLNFEGGKGGATFIGVLLGAHWLAALVFAVAWLGVALGTRYSSLATLVATTAVVLYYVVTGWAGLPIILVMALLIFAKHHANIRRLRAGEESKIGARSSA